MVLLPDGPRAGRDHDPREEVLEGDAGLEDLAEGRLRGRGLVPEARVEGFEDGLAVQGPRGTEAEEFRVAEPGREGAVQLPEEPCVLRGREVAGRDTRRVEQAEGVARE